jgi:hypothetical protein
MMNLFETELVEVMSHNQTNIGLVLNQQNDEILVDVARRDHTKFGCQTFLCHGKTLPQHLSVEVENS